MAITALNNPSANSSIQDNLWHFAQSSNASVIDMKYVFDVFVGSTQLVRVKVYPQKDGWGLFDASRVVCNEIKFDWFVVDSVIDASHCLVSNPDYSGQIAVRYNIRVGEDVTGVTTTNMASGNVTAFNWTPSLFRRRTNFDGKNENWLTNRPYYAKSKYGEHLYIPMLWTSSDKTELEYHVRAVSYSGTTTQANSTTYNSKLLFSFGNVARRIVQLDLKAQKMNYVVQSNIITTDTRYYEVRVRDINTGNYSPWFRVDMDCNPKYQPIWLHFMNRYGMFETARFSLANKLSMEIERKSYQKSDYEYLGSGAIDYYEKDVVYYESKINHSTKLKWSYKLVMDFPTDPEYQWLEELMYSPQIYAEVEDGFYPVTIKNTNYEYVKNVFTGLRQLDLEIEMNQKRFAFKR